MKVLQINTVYKEKSTGRTCFEVEKALNAMGHDCVTAFGKGKKHSRDRENNYFIINNEVEYFLHNLLSRLVGLEGYFSFFSTRRLIRFIEKYHPDIIHLRSLHGHYLNLPLLFRYLQSRDYPVIQNLHDMWSFTGGCCYYTSFQCDKWLEKCKNCPSKKEYPRSWLFDFSSKIQRDKEKWYSKIKHLTVVGVSKWVEEEAKKSFLSKYANITYIYNWINQDIFRPYDDYNDVMDKYGIPKDKFIIIGVSAIWSENTPRVNDFLEIQKHLTSDEVLVMVGKTSLDLSSKGIIHIPFTYDTVELAKLYNCADVYIHCSIQETFGKVIAEAMSCGVPAIVYRTTGCQELVTPTSGFTVEPRDIDGIISCVNTVKKNGKAFYKTNCIRNVKERFSYEKNVDCLVSLYESAINR